MYVEVREIDKTFGDFKASDHVSFGIEKGKLAALLGPSGSGKTTILRIIAGLESADSGDVLINGKTVNNLSPSERGIGFVFQSYALFRYMTVAENIAFGLKVKKLPADKIKERVAELIGLTDLTGLERRYPNELSGGQRQRVAFARALAPEPGLLLLDEPFAAIDAKVRKELRQWLREMIHKVGITSIFVTHDQDEAVEVADQIMVMDKGRIEQTGVPYEIYKEPKTAFVAGFVGNPVILESFEGLKGFEKGEFTRAIIRPEFVEAFKSDNPHFKDIIPFAQEGVIRDILFRGSSLELKIDVGGVLLTTHRSLERRPVEVGEKMNVIIYRLYAIQGNETKLLENQDLKKIDPDNKRMESYLYGDGGYFTT